VTVTFRGDDSHSVRVPVVDAVDAPSNGIGISQIRVSEQLAASGIEIWQITIPAN
jgi:hypothetical protein